MILTAYTRQKHDLCTYRRKHNHRLVQWNHVDLVTSAFPFVPLPYLLFYFLTGAKKHQLYSHPPQVRHNRTRNSQQIRKNWSREWYKREPDKEEQGSNWFRKKRNNYRSRTDNQPRVWPQEKLLENIPRAKKKVRIAEKMFPRTTDTAALHISLTLSTKSPTTNAIRRLNRDGFAWNSINLPKPDRIRGLYQMGSLPRSTKVGPFKIIYTGRERNGRKDPCKLSA